MSTVRAEVTGRGSGSKTFAEWIELQRVVDLKEARRLSGLSLDTIKRRYADKVIQLSPRRRGMKLCDVLDIGAGKQVFAPPPRRRRSA